MRTSLYFLISTALLSLYSCEKDNDIVSGSETMSKTELLTDNSRKLTKAVLVNEAGLESDLTENYTECDFQTTYTYYKDSTFIKFNACYDYEITETWIFNIDSTSLLHFSSNADTTEYKIIELTRLKLKVEQLTNDLPENYKMIFTYEPIDNNK